MSSKHASYICMHLFRRFLISSLGTITLLAATVAAHADELFDFGRSFDSGRLITRGTKVAVANGTLEIKGTSTTTNGTGVVFPLAEESQNLARFREVQADVENTGDQPLTFTFWALSGRGWGGASTYTPDRGPVSGRETLAPGQRSTLKIDLYARYPGTDVYTPATNPASIRWLEIVFVDSRSAASLKVRSIRATGEGPAEPLNVSRRVLVPEVSRDAPAPGRRVYQQLPGRVNTSISHVLTLPREWQPGRKYPIIVEYTGNIFYHKFCYSTGYTNQGNMAYGLARGEEFICLNLPFITADGQREESNGWGDIDKAVDYCIEAVHLVCDQYGGDAHAVFFVGFSRGELAANYLALRNDRIASLWRAFVGTDPGRPWKPADGAGWNKVGIGWDERAARLQGRPWFAAPANLGANVHVDVQYLEDRPGTMATRRWMQEVLAKHSGP